MNTIHRILIGLAVSSLLPAAALAQKISYDVGTADFSALKTFAFKEAATKNATEGTTTYDSPFVLERTHAAIASQLEGRGLRRDDAHPDVYVTTRRTFATEYTVYSAYSWPLGYGYGWGWSPSYTAWSPWYGGDTWYTDERIIGTLVVDVEDAGTGRLMWRGIGEKHVHPTSSPQRRTKRVREEVTKIFRNFPTGR